MNITYEPFEGGKELTDWRNQPKVLEKIGNDYKINNFESFRFGKNTLHFDYKNELNAFLISRKELKRLIPYLIEFLDKEDTHD